MDPPRAPGRRSASNLRLVGAGDAPRARTLRLDPSARPTRDSEAARHHADRAGEVARENAQAMQAADPRWVFATRVAGKLEGGKAAVLRPEVRERLMTDARRLGLRPFDGALVIAIVQDEARRGSLAHGRPSLTPDAVSRLRLVRDPMTDRVARDSRVALAHALLAVACAAVAVLTLARWLLR